MARCAWRARLNNPMLIGTRIETIDPTNLVPGLRMPYCIVH